MNAIPYPHVYRVKTETAIGVKTYIDGKQYGNVKTLPDLDPEKELDAMEKELREKLAAIAQ
jgi:predicted CDP-diglyceride synthetase/phosphatidate cytidylyltransferase